MPRSFQYLHGYAVVGVAFVGSMLKDAYDRATDVCEMFPQFEFLPTFLEEILLHHTRLPLLSLPVSTVLVIAALLAGFVATYFRVIEWLWLFLIDFFSGRWIYNLLFVHIPAWVPFLASEPGVPDLLSDPEDSECLDADGVPINGTSAAACAAAMAKLVEVKLQHENRAIERPDDWLVFDPEEDDLVTKKDLEARRLRRALGSGSSTESSSSSSSTTTSTASPMTSPTKKHPHKSLQPEENRPESPARNR